MNIEILEESKNKITFKVEGEDHTILNLLKEELWKDDNVKLAAYKVEHPLIGVPDMTVEVKAGNDVKKVIEDAVKRLVKKLDEAKKQFEKVF